jgi:hypothetical protein
VLRTTARFHANQTGRAIRKMCQKNCALDLLIHNLACLSFDPMTLEYTLGYIHSYYRFAILVW